jgi:hypothetical protein
MKYVLIWILNSIIVTNACFTFKNLTETFCNNYVTCFIDNPLIKIDKIECDPNSRHRLTLHINNLIDLEDLFLRNTETMDTLINVLRNNNSYTVLFIYIKNASSPRRKTF